MWRKTLLVGVLTVACSAPNERTDRAVAPITQGPWSLLSGMSPPQLTGQTATLFGDNKLLVAGGINAIDVAQDRGYVYVFDLSKHTADLKPGGKLNEPRYLHTATLLGNGKILFAGGESVEPRMTAELGDPATGTTTPVAPMRERRSKHAAALLPDGKAIVFGGATAGLMAMAATSGCEIFDPASNTWSDGPAMALPRVFVTATTMKDGKILVVGGPGKAPEVFDPATRTFVRVAPMSDPRVGHVAALLPSGKVLVAGGYTELTGPSSAAVTATAEIFDPATRMWSKAPPMPTPRGNATATVLKNGKVMVAGGRVELTPLNYVDFYDEKTNSWQNGSPMVLPHALHTATSFSNGDVVITGSAYGEIWTPIATGKTCTLAADCETGFCVDGVCCATACTGGCERCDTNAARGTCTAVSGAFNHCPAGNTCIQNQCVPAAGTTCAADKLNVLDKDGKPTSCAPYICDTSVGQCLKQCTTTVECAPGSTCNTANKQCVASSAGDEGGGCSAAHARAGGGLGLFVLALGLLSRRRLSARPTRG